MKKVSYILAFVFVSAIFSQNKTIPNIDIKLISGKTVKINSILKDGPVLINFWATWCAPCKKEMRYLNRFQKEYDNFTILAINEDKTRSFSRVKSFIRTNNYNFIVGLDPNGILFRQLGAQVVPTNILIDTDRTILWQHQGYLPGDEKIIESEIKKAIEINDETNDEKPVDNL